MRKPPFFAIAIAAALVVAGVAGWAATNTQARVVNAPGEGIDPLQLMMSAKQLPSHHYEDYSLIFN